MDETSTRGGNSSVSVGNVGTIRDSIISGRDTIITYINKVTGNSEAKVREHLTRRVEDRWVKSFLSARLLGNEPFAVPAEVQVGERKSEVANALEALGSLPHQDVLILGSPGAGKTILMILLLCARLEAAKNDESEPAPVMLVASSWKDRTSSANPTNPSGDFEEWLTRQIQAEFKVSPRTISEWLKTDRLVLFIDGIDEIESGSQLSFLKGLRSFQASHDLAVYASCRQKDYRGLEETQGERNLLNPDLIVDLEILDPADVQSLIAERRPNLAPVIAGNAKVAELCRSPLVLSLVLEMGLDLANTLADEPLFSALFRHRVRSKGLQLREDNFLEGLSKLGRLLVRNHSSSFHFSDLNYGALRGARQFVLVALLGLGLLSLLYFALQWLGVDRPMWRFLITLVLGMIVGISFIGTDRVRVHQGLTFNPKGGLIVSGVALGFCVLIVFIQVAVLILDLGFFALREHSGWYLIGTLIALCLAAAIWGFFWGDSAFDAVTAFGSWLLMLHLVAFIPILLFGWIIGEDAYAIGRPIQEQIYLAGYALSLGGFRLAAVLLGNAAEHWMHAMAAFTLSIIIVGFLLGMLEFRPADRFSDWRRTLKALVLTTLLGAFATAALIAALLAGIQWMFTGAIELQSRTSAIGVGAGLAAIAGGGGALIYYGLCYLLLASSRTIPWRLSAILNEGVRLGLLIRLAGSYTFLHKSEQDYFAGLSVDRKTRKVSTATEGQALVQGSQ